MEMPQTIGKSKKYLVFNLEYKKLMGYCLKKYCLAKIDQPVYYVKIILMMHLSNTSNYNKTKKPTYVKE